MDKQKTSVFSDYQSYENNSATSRQLQQWLNYVNPIADNSPKFGLQWTLMSNSSDYENKKNNNNYCNYEVSEINQLNKENKFISSNYKSKQNSKNKSYINAMTTLQKKIQDLTEQNLILKKNVTYLKDENNKSFSKCITLSDELKNQHHTIQPRNREIEQLIHENKQLREEKQQKKCLIKRLQRQLRQMQSRIIDNEKYNQQQIQTKKILQQQRQIWCNKKKQMQQEKELMSQQIKNLIQEKRILEDMKQKCTIGILQKYNKSIRMTEQLQNENTLIKNQIYTIKQQNQQDLQKLKENKEISIIRIQNELKRQNEQINKKDNIIKELKQQIQNIKITCEQKNKQLIIILKQYANNNKNINQNNKNINQNKIQQKILNANQINKQQQIKILEKINIQSKQQQINQQNNKRNNQNFLINQSNKCENKKIQNINKDRNHEIHNLPSIKNTQKYQRNQQQQRPSSTPSQKRSVKKTKTNDFKSYHNLKNKKQNQEKNKILMKSQQNKQRLKHEQHIYNSAQHIQNYPFNDNNYQSYENHHDKLYNNNYHQQQQLYDHHQLYDIHEVPSQIAINQFCPIHTQMSNLMLIEVQKQAIRLYEDHQRLLNLSSKNCSPTQRSQYLGRLKQLNEQIKINSDKMMQLKSI